MLQDTCTVVWIWTLAWVVYPCKLKASSVSHTKGTIRVPLKKVPKLQCDRSLALQATPPSHWSSHHHKHVYISLLAVGISATTAYIYHITSNIGTPKNNSSAERRFWLEQQKICNGPEVLQLERRLSSWIRAELVSCSRNKMAGELPDYSRIVLLGLLIRCFLGQVGLHSLFLGLCLTQCQWALPWSPHRLFDLLNHCLPTYHGNVNETAT